MGFDGSVSTDSKLVKASARATSWEWVKRTYVLTVTISLVNYQLNMESVVCSQGVSRYGSSIQWWVGADKDKEQVKGRLSHDWCVKARWNFNEPSGLADENAAATIGMENYKRHKILKKGGAPLEHLSMRLMGV